jgi:hypothetical protein
LCLVVDNVSNTISLGIGCRLDMMAKQLSGFNTASVQEASRAIVALLELKLDGTNWILIFTM